MSRSGYNLIEIQDYTTVSFVEGEGLPNLVSSFTSVILDLIRSDQNIAIGDRKFEYEVLRPFYKQILGCSGFIHPTFGFASGRTTKLATLPPSCYILLIKMF
jgi:hypothetical protein